MDNTGHPTATRTVDEQHSRIQVQGRGVDPTLVPPHQRGLPESIEARMAAAGDHTAPRNGTEVTWRWSHG